MKMLKTIIVENTLWVQDVFLTENNKNNRQCDIFRILSQQKILKGDLSGTSHDEENFFKPENITKT